MDDLDAIFQTNVKNSVVHNPLNVENDFTKIDDVTVLSDYELMAVTHKLLKTVGVILEHKSKRMEVYALDKSLRVNDGDYIYISRYIVNRDVSIFKEGDIHIVIDKVMSAYEYEEQFKVLTIITPNPEFANIKLPMKYIDGIHVHMKFGDPDDLDVYIYMNDEEFVKDFSWKFNGCQYILDDDDDDEEINEHTPCYNVSFGVFQNKDFLVNDWEICEEPDKILGLMLYGFDLNLNPNLFDGVVDLSTRCFNDGGGGANSTVFDVEDIVDITFSESYTKIDSEIFYESLSLSVSR